MKAGALKRVATQGAAAIRQRCSQLRALWHRLHPCHQRWAGADLQGKQLCVVVLAEQQAGARVMVLECATLELDDELTPDELTPDALSALAQGLKNRPERWSLLLPRDDYRISIVAAPEVPAAELAQSLRWQLAPTLDFAAEEAIIDFMQIPTQAWESRRAPELYAIAARGDSVRAQAGIFHAAGLPLAAIDIYETAQRNIAGLTERRDELLVMVVFSASEMRITFSWHGELYLDRLIAETASQDDTPAHRALLCDRLALQVQRSLDAVRSNYPFMQAARIVAAGAPAGFCEHLAASVADPVECLQPDDLFDLSATPELREPANFIRYFHALGAALRNRESGA